VYLRACEIKGRDRRNVIKGLEILEMPELVEFEEEKHGKEEEQEADGGL